MNLNYYLSTSFRFRMGPDKWVFLLNQWVFEELVKGNKNIALNQNSGAEWTQGKAISKIMIMSDVGELGIVFCIDGGHSVA